MEPPETTTPEAELELTEPVEDWMPEALEVPEVLDVLDELDVLDVALEAWVVREAVAVAVPGAPAAPTRPKMPRAPTAATATPAVSWLIRRSARSRAEILDCTFSVDRMGTSFRPALKRIWELPERTLREITRSASGRNAEGT